MVEVKVTAVLGGAWDGGGSVGRWGGTLRMQRGVVGGGEPEGAGGFALPPEPNPSVNCELLSVVPSVSLPPVAVALGLQHAESRRMLVARNT